MREVKTVIDDLVENGGPGDGFRPTELLVGALGACTPQPRGSQIQEMAISRPTATQVEPFAATADKPTS